MAGPWERYQTNKPGPWTRYAAPAEPVSPAAQIAPVPEVAAAPAPAPTPAPEAAPAQDDSSWLDTIMGVVDQGVRGVANGLTNIAGAPQALSQGVRSFDKWALEKLGAPQGVIDAVDYVTPLADYAPSAKGMQDALDSANNATADAFGVTRPRVKPDNRTEQFVERIGEEVGGAMLPVAAALNKARSVGVAGARELPGLAGRLVESAAVDPRRFLRREGAMALGAGAGAATANQIADRDTVAGQVADIVGAIMGAGVTGLSGVVKGVGSDVLAAVTGNPNSASRVVREGVADTLVQNSDIMGRQVDPADLTRPLNTEELVAAISRPPAAEAIIPGLRASTADAAGDAGLASLENARSRVNPGPYRDRVDQNSNVVEAAFRGMRPDENPGAYRAAAEVERDARLRELVMGEQAAAEAAATAARPLTPATTAAQRGGSVREGLEAAREAARARTEEAYGKVDIAGRQVDPAPLAQRLDEAVGSLTEVERGLVPQGVIDRVRSLGAPLENGPQPTGLLDAAGNPMTRPPQGPQPVSMKEATDLRSELQRLQRAAMADPRAEKGGRNAARVLGQMVDTVDGFIASNLDEADQTALMAARGAKFDEAERFTRQGDPVARALGRYEGGQPQVADDRVAGLFVNPQAMDRLFAQAPTPDVRSAIRDEVLSRGDMTSADRINRFMSDYPEQIDKFPGLRDELKSAAAAREREASAASARVAGEREFGTDTTPGRGTVGRYLQYSDANSRRAMRDVMAAKDPGKAADDLVEFVRGDKQAVDGLRAAFWDDLESASRSTNAVAETKSGVMPFIPKKMLAYLDDPSKAAVAERLYRDDPEHLSMIRELAGALKGVNSGQRIGNAVNPSGTAQMLRGQPPVSMAEISSKVYQARIGRVSPLYVGLHIAQKFARGAVSKQATKAYELLLDRALLDKDVAASLLKENNPANRAALNRATRGWLGAEAAAALAKAAEDDDRDEDVKTIMRDQ